MWSRIVCRVDFYEGKVTTGNAVFFMEPSATPFSFAVGEFVDPAGGPPTRYQPISTMRLLQWSIKSLIPAVPRFSTNRDFREASAAVSGLNAWYIPCL